MGIAINSKPSGFRKSAETHEPAKLDRAREESGVDLAADDLPGGRALDQRQPHRPWLVPGTGKL